MRWRPVLGEEEAGVMPDTGAVVQGEEEGTRWEDRRKRPEVETRCFPKIVCLSATSCFTYPGISFPLLPPSCQGNDPGPTKSRFVYF